MNDGEDPGSWKKLAKGNQISKNNLLNQRKINSQSSVMI